MGERNPISTQLRNRRQAISDTWESRIRAELPKLRVFDGHALCDHLPELLEALARWVEGDFEEARPGLEALADGHAIQRLGYGVDLETLTREYALLRSTLVRECIELAIERSSAEHLARLDEALDIAILGAVRRYTSGRDQIRDRFIGILAHDLRNPLHAIAMATEHLLETGNQPPAIHAISRSAGRMNRMIEDVILLAREHLGAGIPLVLTRTNLGDLCREALDELATAHPKRTLAIDASGDLRGHFDRDRVLQAMSNVIGNAIHHGADPIHVVVREAADRQSVITSVSNGGIAPSKEDLATIFDPFRSGQAQQPKTRGLGLGLYIVRAIARAHGALCEVETGTGDRAFTFRIVWPRVPEDQVPLRGTSP
jgi:signal transduction histidine kinase